MERVIVTLVKITKFYRMVLVSVPQGMSNNVMDPASFLVVVTNSSSKTLPVRVVH